MPAVFKHPLNWQATRQETSQLNNHHDKRTARKPHTPSIRCTQPFPHGQYSRLALHHSQAVSGAPVAGPRYLQSVSRNPHQKPGPGQCSNLSSSRGLLQLAELSLSLLVLICVASAQSAFTGFFGLGALGGSPYFALGRAGNGFPGELSQLTELDLQYDRMKQPAGHYLVGVSGLLLCLALAFLILGCSMSVPEARMLLRGELVTDVLGVLACSLGIVLYVHSIQSANATEVCRRREAIYWSAGYTSMTCDILGTEVAACTFAVLLTMVYFSGAIWLGLSLRKQPQTP